MSEAFRARLARLRREDPIPPAAGGALASPEPRVGEGEERAAPRGMPAWLRAKLGRRAGHASASGEPGARSPAPADDPWPADPAPPARLEEVRGPAGPFALRSERLPAQHRHGDWSLAELGGARSGAVDPFELTTGDPALAGVELARAVFLDTETTGLAGGAGTTVFLVGLGWFEGQRFVLWQGFLRSPAEERALLAAVAERIGGASLLVSFFGKSFDRHRLEDKMRQHGVAPPFEGLPHLDLYHPLRRLYGAAFRDARLCTFERGLCGVQRAGDLPGARAPEAWFDFLAGRPHRLEGVFRHNAEDVLSLVTLAAHLGRTLDETRADGRPLEGCGLARAAALGRLHLARRERDRACAWLGRHLERACGTGSDLARESAYLRAEALRLARRDGESEGAHRAVAAAAQDRWTVRSCIALAMLAEHRRRDPAAARELVLAARELVPRVALGGERARLERDLERRLTRLGAGPV